jgi:hypothetical protein
MKTAEQFESEIANHTVPDELYGVICRIQLTAAKRALELAAGVVNKDAILESLPETWGLRDKLATDILTLRDNLTIEQLNEK